MVGADGRTYRRLDLATALELSAGRAHSFSDVLLSPDGSRLAGNGGYVIDLATADGGWYSIVEDDSQDVWAGAPVLAWSPDGQQLAYKVAVDDVPRPPDSTATGEGVAVLDLRTGAVQIIDTDSGGTRAAFSPDARELAVYTDSAAVPENPHVRIFALAGKVRRMLREIPVPPGHRLANGLAWSPDGELLLTAGLDNVDPRSWSYTFVDATGAGRDVPSPIRFPHDDLVLLGWRSSSTILVGLDDGTAPGPNLVAEVPLDGGPRRIVSRLSIDEHSAVHGLQLASGLLTHADVGDAGPPRHGPWPRWLQVAIGTVVGLVLLAAVVAWRRRPQPG